MKKRIWPLLLLLVVLVGCKGEEDIGGKAKYVVAPWSSCDADLGSALYVNTIDAPQAVMERLEKLGVVPRDAAGVPIAIFTTQDEPKDKLARVGKRFMVLAPSQSGGTTVYILSQHEDKVHASSVGSLAYPILSLAGATSAESPMTIVNSGELIYAVIDDTAYLLSDWAADIAPETLGDLYWGDAPVAVSEIGENASNTFLADYDQLWEDLYRNYPFFPVLEARGIDPAEVQAQYRLLAQDASSVAEFMTALDKMFAKLQCFAHLSLIHPDRYEPLYASMSERTDPMWEPWVSALNHEKTRSTYNSFVKGGSAVELGVPSVEKRYYPEIAAAYFRFPSMMPGSDERDQNVISEYLAELPDVKHIIIDVTGNTGGSTEFWKNTIVEPFGGTYTANYRVYYQNSPLTHTYYDTWGIKDISPKELLPAPVRALDAAYFMDSAIHIDCDPSVTGSGLQAKRWVLIDEKGYSATDQFAAFCKMTGWATLVGKQTGGDGMSGQPVLLRLENTGLLVYFTIGIAPNPDGSLNAEKGTQPDYGCLPKGYTSPLETCMELIRGMEIP